MPHRTLIPTLVTLTLAGACLGGCNMDSFIPELAKDAGTPSSNLKAVLHPSKLRSLPPGVDTVTLEVKDILLRRASDQSWNILNDKPAVWSIDANPQPLPTFSTVPMPADAYDALRVVFGEASVSIGGQRQTLTIPDAQITQEGQWSLSGDNRLELWLDLGQAFDKDDAGAWQVTPKVELSLRDADFSSEGLGVSTQSP